VTQRASALVLSDAGKSCQEVAEVLLFDDDAIHGWYDLFEQGGVKGLTSFEMGVMHKNITHNKTYGTCKEFAEATLDLLRDKVPSKLGQISQYSHRCLSCDIAEGFSDYRVNRVYPGKMENYFHFWGKAAGRTARRAHLAPARLSQSRSRCGCRCIAAN